MTNLVTNDLLRQDLLYFLKAAITHGNEIYRLAMDNDFIDDVIKIEIGKAQVLLQDVYIRLLKEELQKD